MGLSLLRELHFEHFFNHLIEDSLTVVCLGHITELVSHAEQEVFEGTNQLFLLQVLSKVLLAILNHVGNLLLYEGLLLSDWYLLLPT